MAQRNWINQLFPEIKAEGSPVPPGRLIKAVENVIKEDAIICLDVGNHTIWFNRIFSGSRQKILISGNWRSMGFGLPAALAAKLSSPDQQVIAIVGDGGFAQSLADFSTAVRYQLPISIILLNNGYLAMEKDRMQIQGMNYEVTSLTLPDFAGFAELCGGTGFKIESTHQLEDTLKEALNQNTPTIIDIQTMAPVFPGLIDQAQKKNMI